MNINWRTVLATVIGLAFGGGAAYAGIKYYDTHKPTFPGRRGGWTPPVEEEPISKEEAVTDDSEGSDEVVVVDSGSEPKAYVVDDSEFFYGEPEYEKNRDLIWYQESGVLIDDHDEIVECEVLAGLGLDELGGLGLVHGLLVGGGEHVDGGAFLHLLE